MDSIRVSCKAKDDDNKLLHIAMFPWLAFGHMIPFLELAKLLAHKGHRISFISTPRNINRLPPIPPNLSPLINFVKFPLPNVENLPPHAEATTDLPLEDVCYLKNAYDSLKQPLTQFLQSSLPDWILFDFVPYWVPDIAHKFKISNGFFSIYTAACLCFCCPASGDEDYRRNVEDYTEKPKWISFPSSISFRFFEALRVFPSICGHESDLSAFYRLREALKRCDLIAVRTCTEFEPEWLQLLEQLHKKPTVTVGLLPRKKDEIQNQESETWGLIKEWLDKQETRSVVYVAFGSEAKQSQEELTEIAHGLELSELPFLWVLRKSHETVNLPNEFEERVKGKGMICTSWVPQLKILAHDSVGGFLTHSGWSSVVEALQFERALIMLTFFADQGLNAKMFEEKKIGYLIPRNEKDGSFSREAVAESLRMVVVEEEGKVFRDRAKEMKGLFGDWDRQNQYVEEFLDCLQKQSTTKIA